MKSQKTRFVFSVIACLLLGSEILPAQSVNLPMGHWLYRFFDRMAIRGVLEHYVVGMNPISRDQASAYVFQLLQREPLQYTRVETETLNRAVQELRRDLQALHLSAPEGRSETHFYYLCDPEAKGHAALDAVLGGQMERAEADDTVWRGEYGAILRGRLGPVAFYSDNRIYGEVGAGPYSQSYEVTEGYPRNTNADSSMATWDASTSYLVLEYKGLDFQFGRDRIRWGPSRLGGLLLSGLTEPFDFFNVKATLGQVRFQYFHGALQSRYNQKWISGHRIEWDMARRGHVGISETIVYGQRGWEAAYLNPVLPFLISEHTLGDKDNVNIGLDFSFRPYAGWSLYGEIFIDDLVAPWTLFEDRWNNKVAYLMGLSWIDPLGWADARLDLEYQRVDPYVYTHKYDINVYEHYNQGVGSPLNPNADYLSGSLEKMLFFRFMLGCGFAQKRQGPGDRRQPHLESDGVKKTFFMR